MVNSPVTPPRTTESLKIHPPTPTVPRNAASHPYTSTHVERDENETIMWHEISGKAVGAMPWPLFCHEFLPAAAIPAPAVSQYYLKKMTDASSEIAMYNHFVSN